MGKLYILPLLVTVLKNEAPDQKCSLDIKIPIYHVVYKNENRQRLEFNYKIYISKYQSGSSTLSQKTDFGTFEAKEMNCLGALSFVLTDTVYNKKISGRYINAPDTFKQMVTAIDPITDERFKVIETYFEPLPDGTWIFEDLSLNLSDTVNFEKGRTPGKWAQ